MLLKVGENAVPVIALAFYKVLWQKKWCGGSPFLPGNGETGEPRGKMAGIYCHAMLRRCTACGDCGFLRKKNLEKGGKKTVSHISTSFQKIFGRKLNFKLEQ